MNQTRFPTRPVLLVDNEQECLIRASLALNAVGINNIVQCTDSREVMSALSATDFSVVLLDIQMPGLSGYDLLLMILADFPEVAVAVVTAVDSTESAVKCLKTGAYDYLVKSEDDTRLAALVREGIGISDLHHGNPQRADTLDKPEAFADIITQDRAMHATFKYIESIAGNRLSSVDYGRNRGWKGIDCGGNSRIERANGGICYGQCGWTRRPAILGHAFRSQNRGVHQRGFTS